MSISADAMEELLRNPPKGFSVETAPDGTVIRQRSARMGCMTVFLLVWITVWTVGGVSMLLQYFHPSPDKEAVSLPMLLLYWSVEVVIAGFIAFVLLARREYCLTKTELRLGFSLLGLQRKTDVPRNAISGLSQVQDGGDGDDSFPGWGLKLVRTDGKKMRLLFRQPYESSTWLGELIESWSGAPLSRVPDEKYLKLFQK